MGFHAGEMNPPVFVAGADVWLENTLNRRYGGSSRRAVLVAYRDALKRWRSMTGKPESKT